MKKLKHLHTISQTIAYKLTNSNTKNTTHFCDDNLHYLSTYTLKHTYYPHSYINTHKYLTLLPSLVFYSIATYIILFFQAYFKRRFMITTYYALAPIDKTKITHTTLPTNVHFKIHLQIHYSLCSRCAAATAVAATEPVRQARFKTYNLVNCIDDYRPASHTYYFYIKHYFNPIILVHTSLIYLKPPIIAVIFINFCTK